MVLLKSPTARLVAHSVIAALAAGLALYFGSAQSDTQAGKYALIAGIARLVLGYLTSTNPQVGKNVV